MRTALVQSILDDIQTQSSKYYYFLGKTLQWFPLASSDVAEVPEQTWSYERDVRNNIITFKRILATDAALVVPRINWTSGTVYDYWDDNYQSTTQTGVGTITSATDSTTVTGSGTYFLTELQEGDVIQTSAGTTIGTVSSIASNTSLTLTAVASVATTAGFWQHIHTVQSASGATDLVNANFYVLTDIFNVYKCIDNNGGVASTTKPTGTSTGTFTTADGYIWKFMYNIPAALRNKFLTTAYMPVTRSLKNQYYSAGEIISVNIVDGGTGYTSPTLTVTGDGFLADNPQVISGTTITEAGFGYSSAPTITVSAPTVISGSESTATFTCTIDGDGAIDSVTISDAGFGYEALPTVTVAEPVSGATTWEELTSYNLSDKIKYEGNYYNVTSAGTTSTTPPTHTTGAETDGTAELTYIATIADIDAVLTKTEATMTAVLDGGVISNVTITDGGTGYTFGTVTITDAAGSGADITLNLSTGDVNTQQSSVELLAVNGGIHKIEIEDGGSGYSGTPTVTISGDGSGATATCTLNSAGAISTITITDPGSGYTEATVSFSGGGSGETVRPIIAPLGGHGFNAEEELHAKDIMFYSTVSIEKNQGFTLTNDYRQLGIIRSPEAYGSTARYSATLGSACFVLTATIDTADFPIDTEINVSGETKEYRIVAVEATRALVQSLDGDVPQAGDVFENSGGDTFTVTSVTNPTVNKNSGQLMYIDNRGAFTPTDEQTVTIRTVLTV